MTVLSRRALAAAALLALVSGAAEARRALPRSADFTGHSAGMFGTSLLLVGSTPYDSKWARVAHASLPASSGIVARARGLTGLDRLRAVNAAVNRAISYREDSDLWGQPDHWATPREALSKGSGDCEDYAIAKMQALRAVGIPASELFLVVGTDLVARGGHALLVVRHAGEHWVLDNFHDEVRPSSLYRDFRPTLSFGGGRAWLHGYRGGNVSAQTGRSAAARPGAGSALAQVVAAQARTGE